MERYGGYPPIILDYLTTTKKELKSYEGLELIKPTIRFLLQFIGTNLFRNQLHPEIWVNALFVNYPSDELIKQLNSKTDGSYGVRQPNWIITDMRFPNEAQVIKDRGGITIRVNRPCSVCGGVGYHKLDCRPSEHQSETALDDYEFNYVIKNSGTIEELIKPVKEILIKEGIL